MTQSVAQISKCDRIFLNYKILVIFGGGNCAVFFHLLEELLHLFAVFIEKLFLFGRCWL